MFAYCLNNPLSLLDDGGEIPRAVQDKIIHDAVLEAICGTQPNLSWKKTCVYYNKVDHKGGWGFCDLYNNVTGEVWELKKDSNTISCQTSVAQIQLDNYISGKLKWMPELDLCRPYITVINAGSFSFTQGGYIYDVQYWNEGNGILRYNYTSRKTTERVVAEVLVTVAAISIVASIAPYSIPALGMGGAAMALLG